LQAQEAETETFSGNPTPNPRSVLGEPASAERDDKVEVWRTKQGHFLLSRILAVEIDKT
jgi:hypothetical protein